MQKHIHNKQRATVAKMFDSIAWRYDFLNHFFSLHIDKIWRRKAVNELRGLSLDHVLDVATGTGDLALTIHKRLHPVHITGIDISEGMLAIGRKKIEKKGLEQQIVCSMAIQKCYLLPTIRLMLLL